MVNQRLPVLPNRRILFEHFGLGFDVFKGVVETPELLFTLVFDYELVLMVHEAHTSRQPATR